MNLKKKLQTQSWNLNEFPDSFCKVSAEYLWSPFMELTDYLRIYSANSREYLAAVSAERLLVVDTTNVIAKQLTRRLILIVGKNS